MIFVRYLKNDDQISVFADIKEYHNYPSLSVVLEVKKIGFAVQLNTLKKNKTKKNKKTIWSYLE